ncbi:DNA directed RNA polymerase i, second largest subunit, partial [Reticulomyxa filosa]
MAGKCGGIVGQFFDGTPFKFDEARNDYGVDFFGKILRKNGYNYYGSEQMYTGLTGTLMEAEIYIGVVYYQRLRHMVSDKYQVRALGPINALTKQPLKGRKRKGGIRLGEMERDSLISHGCAFLVNDRLFTCSDGELRYMCKHCGLIWEYGTTKILHI